MEDAPPPTFGDAAIAADSNMDIAADDVGPHPQRRRLHLEALASYRLFPASAPSSSGAAAATAAAAVSAARVPHPPGLQQQQGQHMQVDGHGHGQAGNELNTAGPQQQQQHLQLQLQGQVSSQQQQMPQQQQGQQGAVYQPAVPLPTPAVHDFQSLANAFTQGLSMLSDKLERFTTTFEQQMQAQQASHRQQIQALQGKIQEIEQGQEERIRRIMQEMASEHTRPGLTPPASRPVTPRRQQEEDEIARSLVVGTFARNTHKNVIEAALQPVLAKARETDDGAKIYCEYLKSSVGFLAFSSPEQASAAHRTLNEQTWSHEGKDLWVGFKKTRAQRARSTAIRRATAGAKLWSPSVEICFRSGRVWDGDWLVGFWDKEVQRFKFSVDWLEYYSVSSEDVLEASHRSYSHDWG